MPAQPLLHPVRAASGGPRVDFLARRVENATRRNVAKFGVETKMPEFDVEEFVAKMDRLGLKLTGVPLADGKYRVNRWRMSGAIENAEQIRNLWTSQIGDNQSRIDQLAAHLAQAEPRVIANRIYPGLHKAK